MKSDKFFATMDSFSQKLGLVSHLVDRLADKVLPHTTAQATCRPSGCWATGSGCGNHYCCMCTAPGVCYVTQHSQWVTYQCSNGKTGKCWNCIVDTCGWTAVAKC
jgi:hypothetical protein